MKSVSLGFIGGGRITRIFLQAFRHKASEFESIVVCDTDELVLHELKNQFPEIVTTSNPTACTQQQIVFIALHPPQIMPVLEEIGNEISPETSVISLAPKISLEKLASKLPTLNLARMIPNATSYINKGYNPICFHPDFSPEKKATLLFFISQLGKTFETEERKLESYALLSAMLPTYFWFQWKELQEIGQELGLSEEETNHSIYETLKAANELYFNSELSNKEVTDLIPVKPIAEHEPTIKACLHDTLVPLFEKIKA
ncbi:pyrroline-5-carboxylate reductase family protein [Mangrovibacterium lignilyticum]|uniref:pyrroline-5-carboxylate reductase family protein n=1 Tax=Mangrovibacterium lignilyticum TaxID=2668052 RepID=UPI0013D714F9|nr:NAD(P)-binding domain-containing protein [Mangrovibacterium lignilyticum]